MGRGRPPWIVGISERLYQCLLLLYPAGHRREYGLPMAQAFRDLCRQAHRQDGALGVMLLWLRVLPDALATAAVEHLAEARDGGWLAMGRRLWRQVPIYGPSYGGLLLPSFLFFGLLWHWLVRGVLYYCADRPPLGDFFPRFVHGAPDYYIASEGTVYLVWYLFLGATLLLPALAVWLRARRLRLSPPGGPARPRPAGPVSWPAVGLAILPGVLALITTSLGMRLVLRIARLPLVEMTHLTVAGVTVFARALALALLGAWILIAFVARRRLPVWGLSALGLFLLSGRFQLDGEAALWITAAIAFPLVGATALTVADLIRQRQPGSRPPRALWLTLGAAGGASLLAVALRGFLGLLGVGCTLVIVLLGLPLARRHGLLAGIFVAAAGPGLWWQALDLDYGIAGTVWAEAMWALLAGLVLVASIVWVLRARSARGQALGLLMPAGVALMGVVLVDGLIRTNPGLLGAPIAFPGPIGIGSRGPESLWPMLVRNGTTALAYVLALGCAAVLYPWVEEQAYPSLRAQS